MNRENKIARKMVRAVEEEEYDISGDLARDYMKKIDEVEKTAKRLVSDLTEVYDMSLEFVNELPSDSKLGSKINMTSDLVYEHFSSISKMRKELEGIKKDLKKGF